MKSEDTKHKIANNAQNCLQKQQPNSKEISNQTLIELKQLDTPKVIEDSQGGISLSIPVSLTRRSGRQCIRLPNGQQAEKQTNESQPTALQLALIRGHRWQRMLETGECTSLKAIAAKEQLDNSYISRMVNLTNLAPDIVERILDDTLPGHITLFALAVNPPKLWEEQRARLGLVEPKAVNQSTESIERHERLNTTG